MILELAKKGFNVVVHYHRSKEDALTTAKMAEEFGVKTLLIQADVTSPEEVSSAFEKIREKFGKLDIFVHNVGDYLKKNILEITNEEWKFIVDSNLNSTFYCCKEALRIMDKKEYGRIITTGFASVGNNHAEREITPYFIAKNGLLIFTKSLAKELASSAITVNMISPGVLETSISKPIEQIPAKRLGKLSEMIHVLNFLISPESNYVTGVNIEVAGGWNL